MQKIHQEMLFCDNCKKTTVHQGNKKQINWLAHIGLCFIGIGFVTLPLAILGRILTARVGGKKGLYCSVCGNQV